MYTCIVCIFIICNVHVCTRFTWGGWLQVFFKGVGVGATPPPFPTPLHAFATDVYTQLLCVNIHNTIWMLGSKNFRNFLTFFLKYFYTWLRFVSCEREKQRTITLINKKKFLYRKSPVHIESHMCDDGGGGDGLGGGGTWLGL